MDTLSAENNNASHVPLSAPSPNAPLFAPLPGSLLHDPLAKTAAPTPDDAGAATKKDADDEHRVREALEESVNKLRESTEAEAMRIIYQVFPAKILQLHHATQPANGDAGLFNLSIEDLETKVPPPLTPSPDHNEDYDEAAKRTVVPANDNIKRLMGILSAEAAFLSEAIQTLTMWLTFKIPTVSFGGGAASMAMSIQSEVMRLLKNAEKTALNISNGFGEYFVQRASIVSKALSYPNVEDYHIAVREVDIKAYSAGRSLIYELRNTYVSLHDALLKNMAMVAAVPKDDSHMSMF